MTQHSESADRERVCIVGAGLVGALLAVRLAQRGFAVDLFEKRPDLRRCDLPGGRSIVMSLSDRGWRGLAAVGMEEEIKSTTLPKHSRMVHLSDGTASLLQYGREEHAIWTVDRKLLNCRLLERAENTGRVALRFQHECRRLDLEAGEVEFADLAGGGVLVRRYARIFGTDGIFSRVRAELRDAGAIKDKVSTLEFGYRELFIPPRLDGGWALPEHFVHVWPRPNSLLIALPNRNGSFTCMLIMRLNGNPSLPAIRSAADLQALFTGHFAELVPLMPTLSADFFRNPISNIHTVQCAPWHYRDRICLLGDACHAIAPFFAMGMNVGFEDVDFLMALLDEHHGDWERAFAELSVRRKPDTDAIAALSLENFEAIGRSSTADAHLKWDLERRLWDLFPDRWAPLYVMIAISRLPLSQVAAIHQRQSETLDALIHEHGVRDPGRADLPALAARLLARGSPVGGFA